MMNRDLFGPPAMESFMLRERYKCRKKCEHGAKCQMLRGHREDHHQWHCLKCYEAGVEGAVRPQGPPVPPELPPQTAGAGSRGGKRSKKLSGSSIRNV